MSFYRQSDGTIPQADLQQRVAILKEQPDRQEADIFR
jgi:hypothetical protein